MQELDLMEIDEVSGGVNQAQVLNIGAGITAVGAAVLVGVGSPLLVPAAAAFGIVSAGLWTYGALVDAGFSSGLSGGFSFNRPKNN